MKIMNTMNIEYAMKKRCGILLSIALLFSTMMMPRMAMGMVQLGVDDKKELPKDIPTAKKVRRIIVQDYVLHEPLPCMEQIPPLLGQKEKDELQISWLVESLDTTLTSFGSWGLKQLISPTTDRTIIENRQTLIRAIAEDNALFNRIHTLLKKIERNENALLAYWKPDEVITKSAESLYYSLPLPAGINKKLNHSAVALEGTMWLDMAKSSLAVIAVLGLNTVLEEFVFWARGMGEPDVSGGLWRGIKGPLLNNLPLQTDIGKKYSQRQEELKQKMQQTAEAGQTVEQLKKLYEFNAKEAMRKAWQDGTLGDRLKVLYEVKKGDSTLSKVGSGLNAVFWAGGQSLWSNYVLYKNVTAAFSYWRRLITTTKLLRKRLIDVSQCMQNMQELARVVQRDEVLRETCIAKHFDTVFNKRAVSKKLRELIALFSSSTFKNNKSQIFYSRGRMLLAHKLLNEIRNELVPALQAVGELDALHAIAGKCQQQNMPWTFVEFVEHNTPIFELEQYHIPMYGAESVENSIAFGVPGSPTKVLITGPNGGGKSVTIKLVIGQSAVLAQSIGVVPAKKMRMTMLDGMRTCVNPKENMRKKMSTFMAASAGMDALNSFMNASDAHKKYMILVDEPYRGTVNDETAMRTGKFCSDIVQKQYIIAVIATHIMPELREHERQLFGYHHVEILEQKPGEFVRTFKLKPGLCDWWFNDRARRSRYVDWIKTQYKYDDVDHDSDVIVK